MKKSNYTVNKYVPEAFYREMNSRQIYDALWVNTKHTPIKDVITLKSMFNTSYKVLISINIVLLMGSFIESILAQSIYGVLMTIYAAVILFIICVLTRIQLMTEQDY